MRITIEPTAENCLGVPCIQHKVVIETPHDDLNIDDTRRLLARALVAYGFSNAQVQRYLEEVAEE